MPRFEHIRHKQPLPLAQPRELIVILAPMRSSVNLSRIVRLCGCAGVKEVIQCGPGKIDREIARDAIDYVKVTQRRSLLPVMENFRKQSLPLVGLEQTTHSQSLFEYSYPRRIGLVIGSEREGLSQDELDLLDAVIEIPVYGMPFSYNVATAATMAIYEYCKQYPSG
jgi:tRNA G18 (ribose-2'-O)-methylase SpoU